MVSGPTNAAQGALFYGVSLGDPVPKDHLLRSNDRCLVPAQSSRLSTNFVVRLKGKLNNTLMDRMLFGAKANQNDREPRRFRDVVYVAQFWVLQIVGVQRLIGR